MVTNSDASRFSESGREEMSRVVHIDGPSSYLVGPGVSCPYHTMVSQCPVCNFALFLLSDLHRKDLRVSDSQFQISDTILETHIQQDRRLGR